MTKYLNSAEQVAKNASRIIKTLQAKLSQEHGEAVNESLDLIEYLAKYRRGIALYQMLESSTNKQAKMYKILEYNANLQN